MTVHLAVPPTKAELVGLKSGSDLVVKEQEEVELRCIIHNARPRPDIIWYLGDQEFVRGKWRQIGISQYSARSFLQFLSKIRRATFNLFMSEKQRVVCVAGRISVIVMVGKTVTQSGLRYTVSTP